MERDALVRLLADGVEAMTAAHDALLDSGAYVVSLSYYDAKWDPGLVVDSDHMVPH